MKFLCRFWPLAALVALCANQFAEAAEDGLAWQDNLDAACQQAAQSNRLVLVHFGADWCEPCQRLERNVFSQPGFGNSLNQHYVAVKLNADHYRSTCRHYGVKSYPTDVVITPDGQLIQRIQSPAQGDQYVAALTDIALQTQPQPQSGQQRLAQRRQPQPQQQPADDPRQPTRNDRIARYAPRQPDQQLQNRDARVDDSLPPQLRQPASQPPEQNMADGDRYGDYYRRRQATLNDRDSAPGERPESANAPAGQTPARDSDLSAWPETEQANFEGQLQDRGAVSWPAQREAAGEEAQPPVRSQQGRYLKRDGNTAPRDADAPVRGDRYAARDNRYPINGTAPDPNRDPRESTPPRPDLATQQAQPDPAAENGLKTDAPPERAASEPAPPQLPPGNPPLGLEGFCPVTLSEKKSWQPGDTLWGVIHRGRTYLFSGQAEQKMFLANPDQYSPVISGNDPVLALDRRQNVAGKREFGVFYEDRVYLFASEASLSAFERDPTRYATTILEALRRTPVRSR